MQTVFRRLLLRVFKANGLWVIGKRSLYLDKLQGVQIALHVDFVILFLPWIGSCNILNIVGQSTRPLEAIPIRNIRSATAVSDATGPWVSPYGEPVTVTTDCATRLEFQLLRFTLVPLMYRCLSSCCQRHDKAFTLAAERFIRCFRQVWLAAAPPDRLPWLPTSY